MFIRRILLLAIFIQNSHGLDGYDECFDETVQHNVFAKGCFKLFKIIRYEGECFVIDGHPGSMVTNRTDMPAQHPDWNGCTLLGDKLWCQCTGRFCIDDYKYLRQLLLEYALEVPEECVKKFEASVDNIFPWLPSYVDRTMAPPTTRRMLDKSYDKMYDICESDDRPTAAENCFRSYTAQRSGDCFYLTHYKGLYGTNGSKPIVPSGNGCAMDGDDTLLCQCTGHNCNLHDDYIRSLLKNLVKEVPEHCRANLDQSIEDHEPQIPHGPSTTPKYPRTKYRRKPTIPMSTPTQTTTLPTTTDTTTQPTTSKTTIQPTTTENTTETTTTETTTLPTITETTTQPTTTETTTRPTTTQPITTETTTLPSTTAETTTPEDDINYSDCDKPFENALITLVNRTLCKAGEDCIAASIFEELYLVGDYCNSSVTALIEEDLNDTAMEIWEDYKLQNRTVEAELNKFVGVAWTVLPMVSNSSDANFERAKYILWELLGITDNCPECDKLFKESLLTLVGETQLEFGHDCPELSAMERVVEGSASTCNSEDIPEIRANLEANRHKIENVYELQNRKVKEAFQIIEEKIIGVIAQLANHPSELADYSSSVFRGWLKDDCAECDGVFQQTILRLTRLAKGNTINHFGGSTQEDYIASVLRNRNNTCDNDSNYDIELALNDLSRHFEEKDKPLTYLKEEVRNIWNMELDQAMTQASKTLDKEKGAQLNKAVDEMRILVEEDKHI